MCRSIKTLRPPYVEQPTEEEVRAAALQYVRKVSGFRVPSRANATAFDEAVAEITRSTHRLLADLRTPRGRPGNAVSPERLGARPTGQRMGAKP